MSSPPTSTQAKLARTKALSFRQLLEETSTFVTVAEVVTSRGLISEPSGRKVLSLARQLSEHPRFHALSITDNPGGHSMASADTLGTDLIARGQEVIIHLSCKDWNRNALESRAWKLASEGFKNVLALSGDYPVGGYQGQAAPVFDTDSVGLLKMYSGMKGAGFFLGAVVNNHKLHEREVMPQYFKLAMKIESGASFIINQIGYNPRKDDELLRYMALNGMKVPVIGNVYVLNVEAARYFHSGRIPGVVVPDALLALAERQQSSPDRGKSFFLELAAKQCAIAQGLGFRGVYLGGRLRLEDYERIFQTWDGFSKDDWKGFVPEITFARPGEFCYFEPDVASGLNSNEISREYLRSKASPSGSSLSYKLNRFVHDKVFASGSAGFRAGASLYQAIDKDPGVRKVFHKAEEVLKVLAFDCRDCGDCSLPDIAFLCPESQCVKNQRNGPCGGTRHGLCEVGEKECIWARAYDRLKAEGEEESMLKRPVVYRNGALAGTSAWGNTFLGRDHNAQKKQEKE